jgi:uncharacterized protein YaaQ
LKSPIYEVVHELVIAIVNDADYDKIARLLTDEEYRCHGASTVGSSGVAAAHY